MAPVLGWKNPVAGITVGKEFDPMRRRLVCAFLVATVVAMASVAEAQLTANLAHEFQADNGASGPQNNPLSSAGGGSWTFYANGDSQGSSTVVSSTGDVGAGVGKGWDDPSEGIGGYASGGPHGLGPGAGDGIVQHTLGGGGISKIDYTVGTTGNYDLNLNLQQKHWEAARQNRFRIFHNNFDLAGTPIVTLESPLGGTGDPGTPGVSTSLSGYGLNSGDILTLAFDAGGSQGDGTGTFSSFNLLLSATPGTPSDNFVPFSQSMAELFANDFSGAGLPQNNPNGNWTYYAAGDSQGNPSLTTTGNVSPGSLGGGWDTGGAMPGYARGGAHGTGPGTAAIASHTTDGGSPGNKIDFDVPADGLFDLKIDMYQPFEASRSQRFAIYKNDFAGANVANRVGYLDIPLGETATWHSTTLSDVALLDSDTVTLIVDGAGAGGNNAGTFLGYNLTVTQTAGLIPEPASASLLLLSICGLLGFIRKR